MARFPKDLRKIAKEYKAMGYAFKVGGSGHMKWIDPDGKVATTTSSTPSDGHRVAQKTTSILKRHEEGRS